MKMHYKVRSVLLSHGSAALTLTPVEWNKDSDTEMIEGDDGPFPAWEMCDPSDPKAEPFEPGGKMTELRVSEPDEDWRPGDFLTLTVERTRTSWPHD